MEEENKMIDQSQLAEDVSNNVKYNFMDMFLVKPLDPVKVKKEISKPVATGTSKDENGIEAQDFDKVETEVQEVNSDYRRGIVIKVPLYFDTNAEELEKSPWGKIKIGDVVIFRDTAGMWFDLLKDSRLLRQYDILGVEDK